VVAYIRPARRLPSAPRTKIGMTAWITRRVARAGDHETAGRVAGEADYAADPHAKLSLLGNKRRQPEAIARRPLRTTRSGPAADPSGRTTWGRYERPGSALPSHEVVQVGAVAAARGQPRSVVEQHQVLAADGRWRCRGAGPYGPSAHSPDGRRGGGARRPAVRVPRRADGRGHARGVPGHRPPTVTSPLMLGKKRTAVRALAVMVRNCDSCPTSRSMPEKRRPRSLRRPRSRWREPMPVVM
jgi:hypothetical protein